MRSRLIHNNAPAFVLALLSILFCVIGAQAQSSSFTYQGRLTDGGAAANVNYDLQFALFDSLSGGAQVGSTQTLNTVAVSNGVFTVGLDFGANAFNGANRFLEISASHRRWLIHFAHAATADHCDALRGAEHFCRKCGYRHECYKRGDGDECNAVGRHCRKPIRADE